MTGIQLHIAVKVVAALLFISMLSSCGSDDKVRPGKVPATDKGTFTDVRDGETYHWVRYGNLEWMSDNFRYDCKDDSKSLVFKNVGTNTPVDVRAFGRLYSYSGAVQACPEGWRLPTDDDWKDLERHLGMAASDAEKREWRGNIAHNMLTTNGDSCDLNLQLGGYYTSHTIMGTTGYRFFSVYAYYWTATQDTAKGKGYYFFRKLIYNSDQVYRESMEPEAQFLSVRYVRDAE